MPPCTSKASLSIFWSWMAAMPHRGRPGVDALCTPDPLGQDRGLPAAAPLATTATATAPVTAAVAIGTLLLRPGFIHNQGPPGKLRAMQSLDSLLRLSRRTHIDKTKSP